MHGMGKYDVFPYKGAARAAKPCDDFWKNGQVLSPTGCLSSSSAGTTVQYCTVVVGWCILFFFKFLSYS